LNELSKSSLISLEKASSKPNSESKASICFDVVEVKAE
jgi:hypothetical protein